MCSDLSVTNSINIANSFWLWNDKYVGAKYVGTKILEPTRPNETKRKVKEPKTKKTLPKAKKAALKAKEVEKSQSITKKRRAKSQIKDNTKSKKQRK